VYIHFYIQCLLILQKKYKNISNIISRNNSTAQCQLPNKTQLNSIFLHVNCQKVQITCTNWQ